MSLLARVSGRYSGLISERKVPHCRTCGTPMKGHKKPNGTLTCPVALDAHDEESESEREESPPPSLTHLTHRTPSPVNGSQLSQRSPSIASSVSSEDSHSTFTQPNIVKYPYSPIDPDPSFEIPEHGNWARRNPYLTPSVASERHSVAGPSGRALTPTEPDSNTGDAPPPRGAPPPAFLHRTRTPGRELTPTEIVDELYAPGPAHAPDPVSAASAPVAGPSRLTKALSCTVNPILSTLGRLCVTIYETREENLQIMRERATSAGMYSDAVPIPDEVVRGGDGATTWFIASESPSRVSAVRKSLLREDGPSSNCFEDEDRGEGSASVTFASLPGRAVSRKGKEREGELGPVFAPRAQAVATAPEEQGTQPQIQLAVSKHDYQVGAGAVAVAFSFLFGAMFLYAGLFGNSTVVPT